MRTATIHAAARPDNADASPSHALPEPRDCAIVGATLGGVGGAAGAAEYAEDHDDGEAAGIGIASVLGGAALGYGLCWLLQPDDSPQTVARATPPVSAAPPPAEPVLTPAQAAFCSVPSTLEGFTFATNSAEIRPVAGRVLDNVAVNLAACPRQDIRIHAHTDSVGSDDYNQALSERRAASVRSHLVTLGINPARLRSVGFGESQPVADNGSSEGRQRNRRVELYPTD